MDRHGEYVTWNVDNDGTDEEALVCDFPNGFLEIEITGGPEDNFIRLEGGSRTTDQSDAAIDVRQRGLVRRECHQPVADFGAGLGE